MAHDHGHGHAPVRYLGSNVDDETLTLLRDLNPPLAENLEKARGAEDELSDEDRQALAESQRAIEAHPAWTPGYHAAGDHCATCGEEIEAPVFEDRFEQGTLPYGAFVTMLPVHLRASCIVGFVEKHPRLAPRDVDRLRRELMRDLNRPSPSMTMFFRHDVLAHPPFELEDWASSVAEANPERLDRQTVRDMERLLQWVHHRLFHHH